MFIIDYHRIKHKLVRKPYPLSRIGKTMQQLVVFQHATALDLNIEYNNLRLLPTSQDMTMIVTEFGKFRCNCLPVGMCALGYIFQAKVYKLLGNIEDVKTYIYVIFTLNKEFFVKHIKKLRIFSVDCEQQS